MKRLSLQHKQYMKHFISIVLISLLCGQAAKAITPKPQDSVGIAQKNGLYFIIHEVESRQTLFALSKIYTVPIQEILEANEGMRPALFSGQLVYVPAKNFKPNSGTVFSSIENGKLAQENGAPKEEPKPTLAPKEEKEETIPPKKTDKNNSKPAETPQTKQDVPDADSPAPQEGDKYNWSLYNGESDLLHTVKKGETLYRIATFYGLSVQELMDLNNLENSLIELGQKLLIKTATPKKQEPKKQEPKKQEAPPTTKKQDEPQKETKKDVVETPAPKEEKDPVVETPAPTVVNGEVKEEGMGMVLDASFPDSDKNIALHSKAKVGTIIMVTNPASRKTVYVRVVGLLQSTDKSVIIILSPEAAKLIDANGTKVILRLSYAQ